MSGPGAGFEFKPKEVSWNKRDSLLFSVSIGADADELQFVFEQNPNFQAFPTYATILPFKGTSQDVIDFGSTIMSQDIPGVPKLRPERIIDAHRAMTWYKPLPASSEGKVFEGQQKVIGVYDKGKAGSVLETETVLRDKNTGEVYVRLVGSTFFIGQGNWGGPKGPSPASYPAPKKSPDGVETHQTTTQSPLIYRLNGDYNPLHVIEGPGKAMGFGGAIMHGLFTYNVAAHSVLKNVGRSDRASLRHFSARFQAPVKPGDKLVTEVWKTGEFDGDGFEEIRFTTKVEGGKVVLSNGRALVKTGGGGSKL